MSKIYNILLKNWFIIDPLEEIQLSKKAIIKIAIIEIAKNLPEIFILIKLAKLNHARSKLFDNSDEIEAYYFIQILGNKVNMKLYLKNLKFWMMKIPKLEQDTWIYEKIAEKFKFNLSLNTSEEATVL
ncbi:hypothetical protein BpHYR1_027966 [Brachionus plicatilis]|uniref:Uncharacterized protein n=1 Tax=Brachionus plicatilis TaxID=10195 RepID=A0A3M7QTE5_BRAPC|nr:hypothetical protein BpHYR1_027966 [Brachionus plicatilis]